MVARRVTDVGGHKLHIAQVLLAGDGWHPETEQIVVDENRDPVNPAEHANRACSNFGGAEVDADRDRRIRHAQRARGRRDPADRVDWRSPRERCQGAGDRAF